MAEMKFDMSGGAAVIEAVAAIARLRPARQARRGRRRDREPARAAARSSPATSSPPPTARRSRSTTPTPRAGSCSPTASATPSREGAERIVDLATLTGAVIVALGSTYAGLMSNDDELAAQVTAAGERTGEIVWRLPLHEEYDELIKGTLRRSRQRARSAQGGHDRRRRVPLELRRRRCRGRTSTSPARPGISGGPTRARAPPATACACSSSSRARSAPSHRRPPARLGARPAQPLDGRRPRRAARIDELAVAARRALDLDQLDVAAGRSGRPRA